MKERTIHYKTSIKRAMVESIRSVFDQHPDKLLSKTKVTIEHPQDKNRYPSVVVRFFERDIRNMGIAHMEILPVTNDGTVTNQKFKHYIYKGEVEFGIYALSSLDCDLIADTIVQTLAMGDMEAYTNQFFERIYEPAYESGKPFININTDVINGVGEQVSPAPWDPDSQLIYQAGYRCDVGGEFYSLEDPNSSFEIIEQINQFPYVRGLDEVPEGTPGNDSEWQPDV